MKRSDSRVVLLVLGSGFCALVYQVAWFRLLRLVFGSSTPVTAAVLEMRAVRDVAFGSRPEVPAGSDSPLHELERLRSRQTLRLRWRLGSPTDSSRN